ncbi:MAG TPA: sigma factor, partial [Longimicrobium sp.]|nr:sigma factor [Longimicrobium sp.]
MTIAASALPVDLAPARAAAAPVAEDEAALVERVRRGDPAAFDALVGRYMRRAFAVAWRLLGNREDAEDLVQDGQKGLLHQV